MEFGSLLESIVVKGPAHNDPQMIFAPFEFDDKVLVLLVDFPFQILNNLGGIFTKVDINSFGFGLENAVFIP